MILFPCRQLEEDGVLHPDSEFDLYCLHVVYKPLIAEFLKDFTDMWNNHDLRTVKGNPTPECLFIKGYFLLKKIYEETGRPYTELQQVKYKI